MSALSQPAATVTRDHAWIEREYNKEKYPVILDAVREVMTDRVSNLARGVGQVIDAERGHLPIDATRDFLIDGSIHHLPTALGSAGVSGFTSNAIASMCSKETDAIVELGAGWGRNLFLTYFAGAGNEATQYYALEYAETARQATRLLARLDQRLSIDALPFDYHVPNFEDIPKSAAPTVLATVHSVEQIPYLSEAVFMDFLLRRPNTSGIHIEPVGWQLPPEVMKGRQARSSAAYAEKHDYNRNLWQTLTNLEAAGHIKVTDVMPDIVGQNLDNPATLIRWTRR